jgi:deoxyadenosine/deoxycytidine kinase
MLFFNLCQRTIPQFELIQKRSLFSATKLYKKNLYNSIKHESNENECNTQLTKIQKSEGIKGKCFWKLKIVLYLKATFNKFKNRIITINL